MRDQHLSSVPDETEAKEHSSAHDGETDTTTPINGMLRQALPSLRRIALYAALAGPTVIDPNLISSYGHGGWR
jgi:hypothetical protein